jgi:predicted flap endonuclease-1-like 5' DNA nuclease
VEELCKLINIGERIEKNLNEIGVFMKEDLAEMGALEAWSRIRANYPSKDICV